MGLIYRVARNGIILSSEYRICDSLNWIETFLIVAEMVIQLMHDLDMHTVNLIVDVKKYGADFLSTDVSVQSS